MATGWGKSLGLLMHIKNSVWMKRGLVSSSVIPHMPQPAPDDTDIFIWHKEKECQKN